MFILRSYSILAPDTIFLVFFNCRLAAEYGLLDAMPSKTATTASRFSTAQYLPQLPCEHKM